MKWARAVTVGVFACGAQAACLPSSARAEPSPSSAAAQPPYRAGFTMGVLGGVLLGNGRGYPNVGEKLNDPEFETRTGLGVSAGEAIWFGAALADWLTASVGVAVGGWTHESVQASVTAFQFRIEGYPLYSMGGTWRDFGLVATTGVGLFIVENEAETLVDGGGTSAVGLGVFHESVRLWGLRMGPQLEYSAQFSHNVSMYNVVLGWRTSFYAEP